MAPSATASPDLANALRAFRLTLAIAVAREIAGLQLELPLLQKRLPEFEDKKTEWRNGDGATLAQVRERYDWILSRQVAVKNLSGEIEARLAQFVEENAVDSVGALHTLAFAFVEEIWPRRLEFYVPAAREVLIRALARLKGVDRA